MELLLSIISFIVTILFLVILVLFITSKGDTFKERLQNAFQRLLRWADLGSTQIQKEQVPKMNYHSEEEKNDPFEIVSRNEILELLSEYKNSIEIYTKNSHDALYGIIKSEFDALNKEIQEQSKKIESIERKINTSNHNQCNVSEKQNIETLTKKINDVFPVTKFGKLVDCYSPLGFVDANLLDKPEGCCFSIFIISNGIARYRLVENSEMKQEALQMFNPVISTGCEFDNRPTIIQDAINVEDGSLKLNNGIWTIISKNKIKLI